MNKKDIALTVGGTLATMVLAYLLYQHQQASAAAAAANSDAAQQAAYDEQAQQEQYLSQLPSTSATTSLDTSNEGTTDTTSSTGTDSSATTDGLLSSIISAFAGSINQSTPGSTVNASLIPTINSGVNLNLTDVPTTASQVLAAANAGAPATVLPTAGPTSPVSASHTLSLVS